ncbi:MAG: Asp-tRNA(Asn)/Glu-tRNA(Gln) amidotransferase subunit GatC [bacterium]|nr:Asp-tRNA(Asn)/Glu-tRNA(Gln) amidotransferase subunit GatC [bacterium]
MALSTQQIEHIAKLSRLDLTSEQMSRYGGQLSNVLEYIKELDQVDTTGIEPTINTTGIEDRLREDILDNSLTQEEALSNTKQHHNGYIIVPNVFDEK